MIAPDSEKPSDFSVKIYTYAWKESSSLGGGYTCVYFDCVVAKIENDPPIPGVSEASMEPGVVHAEEIKNREASA
jgi:hypothetical protein